MATVATTVVAVLNNTNSSGTMDLYTTIDAGVLLAGRGMQAFLLLAEMATGVETLNITKNSTGDCWDTAECSLTGNAG